MRVIPRRQALSLYLMRVVERMNLDGEIEVARGKVSVDVFIGNA